MKVPVSCVVVAGAESAPETETLIPLRFSTAKMILASFKNADPITPASSVCSALHCHSNIHSFIYRASAGLALLWPIVFSIYRLLECHRLYCWYQALRCFQDANLI